MAKHNPKLNPCRPVTDSCQKLWDLAGEVKESKWINGSGEKAIAAELVVSEGLPPRHMRKVFFLSGRQLRKAVTIYKARYNV